LNIASFDKHSQPECAIVNIIFMHRVSDSAKFGVVNNHFIGSWGFVGQMVSLTSLLKKKVVQYPKNSILRFA
jgi:hypothetical protein